MSFISCPLCGKNSCLNYFDPSSLDLTISIHDVKGLGRGKGFKNVNKRNAYVDSIEVKKIKHRLLDLFLFLYKNDIINEDEVAKKLSLSIQDQSEFIKKYNKLLSMWTETKNELKKVEKKLNAYSGIFSELIYYILDALEEDLDDWDIDDRRSLKNDDESIDTLKFGVERLIDDYLALKADEED